MTQLTREALMEIGACSLDEPHPKFLFATIISPAVCRQFLRIRRIQITCRNDDIRIDIVSVFKYMTLCCFHALYPFLAYAISSGPDNFPVMALAAATAGLAR